MMMMIVLSTMMMAQLVVAGPTTTTTIVNPKGNDLARITRDAPGRYSVYDLKSNRLGYGQESSYGTGDIEFFKANGDRWFTVKPDTAPIGERGGRGSGRGSR